jgi:DNA-binding response OmpR family regulator
MVVEDAGYLPLVAAHGRLALELARARQPALIITDLMMPYLTGADLIQAVRAAAGHRAPPIILISAAGPKRLLAAGADAILRKPFDIAELDALLHRYLDPGGEPAPESLA